MASADAGPTSGYAVAHDLLMVVPEPSRNSRAQITGRFLESVMDGEAHALRRPSLGLALRSCSVASICPHARIARLDINAILRNE